MSQGIKPLQRSNWSPVRLSIKSLHTIRIFRWRGPDPHHDMYSAGSSIGSRYTNSTPKIKSVSLSTVACAQAMCHAASVSFRIVIHGSTKTKIIMPNSTQFLRKRSENHGSMGKQLYSVTKQKIRVSLRILDPWLPSPPGSSPATGRKSSAAAAPTA